MPGLIVIGGAPGCGKSTLATQLRALLRGPWIDFGRLREFHLERDWSNESIEEEAMTFENLISMVRNYLRHGYNNILVDDLRDHRIQQISSIMSDAPLHILTLFISNPSLLRRRVMTRNEGWKDAEAAVKWNQDVIERAAGDREYKIDVTTKSPAEVVEEALKILDLIHLAPRAANGAPA
jgi:broad-specificity NMP kinase